MAISLTARDFEDVNLYSNANMERLARSVVNKSSNAALVSMYEDQVILFDHDTGVFYSADYSFDKDRASFAFENFEQIEVVADESNFKNSARNFFEDEDASIGTLIEDYKTGILDSEKFVKELVNEALSLKDFSNIVDYSELSNISESLTVQGEKYFNFYRERLKTHPVNEIKYFDWTNPVYVSLMETTEPVKLISKSVKAKAPELWKNKEFKTRFYEAIEEMTEDEELGVEKLLGLFEDYPGVYFLDGVDRKTLFGKTIIGSSMLRESLDEIQKILKDLFEGQTDIAQRRSELLTEAEDEDMEDEDMEDEDMEDEEEAMELSPEDLKKIAGDLGKVAEKVEDEKLKEKLQGIIDKLSGSEEGTKPEDVKEAVQILGYLL